MVVDTSILSPFARAGRLDTLRTLLRSPRVVTTEAVLDELRNGVSEYPELATALDIAWLEVASLDGRLDFIARFARYYENLGGGGRNLGEATVMAYAELEGCVAVLDDEVAVKLGRRRGVNVIRTLRLIADAVRSANVTILDAEALVDELRAAGGRYPCDGKQLTEYLRRHGMI